MVTLPTLQQFPVLGDVRVKRCGGVGAVDDGGAGLFSKRDVPAHEVGVKMRFEDVLDVDPVGRRAVDVGLHFTQGVDDDALAVAVDVVGALCQAAGVNLFDVHDRV